MNPYQQNIDIIKDFFKRKIILIYAILIILPIFMILFIDFHSMLNTVRGFVSDSAYLPYGTTASAFTMFVFKILIAVVFLLFFVKSASDESSLKAPSGMFRVFSVIEFIFTALYSLALVFAVMIASLYIMSNYTASKALLVVPFMFAAVPVILLLALSQAVFARSVKESVSSIYLKKQGAKFYGVMNIFAAVFCLYGVTIRTLFMSDYNFGQIFGTGADPLVIFLALTAIKYIFGAVVGFKYAKSIAGFADSALIREVSTNNDDENKLICKKCGKPLTPDDYFCNHCGTPVDK